TTTGGSPISFPNGPAASLLSVTSEKLYEMSQKRGLPLAYGTNISASRASPRTCIHGSLGPRLNQASWMVSPWPVAVAQRIFQAVFMTSLLGNACTISFVGSEGAGSFG